MAANNILCLVKIIAYLAIILCQNYCIIVQGRNEVICFTDLEPCSNLCEPMNIYSVLKTISNASIKGIDLKLCSGINLTESLVFKDKNVVSLSGMGKNSTIWCQNVDTGIKFLNTRRVVIKDLSLFHCSSPHKARSKDVNTSFNSSITIENSISITITQLEISWSNGIGLAMIDPQRRINISDSTLTNNAGLDGGGIYIDSSTQTTHSILHIQLRDSILDNNSAESQTEDIKSYPERAVLSNGGALKGFFRRSDYNVTLEILNCSFKYNNSTQGGAVYLRFEDQSEKSVVYVNDSVFEGNMATACGGGMTVIYTEYNHESTMIVFNSTLHSNRAKKGGGMHLEIATTNSCLIGTSKIEFISCKWRNNRAYYGSGINILPHYPQEVSATDRYTIVPVFRDCEFKCNRNENESKLHYNNYLVLIYGKGTLCSSEIDILFKGETLFQDNVGSAIYLISSTIEFNSNSKTEFMHNLGYNGGAISLYGTSTIQVQDDLEITFHNNRAFNKGGGIYQKIVYTQLYISPTSCFIHHHGKKTVSERNIFISFSNNTAETGNSIFLSSIYPCQANNNSLLSVINSIANFTFHGYNTLEVATLGYRFETTDNSTVMTAVPGKISNIAINIVDDASNKIKSVYTAYVSNKSKVKIDPAYTYIINNKIRLLGKPNSTGNLSLSLLALQDISLIIKVKLEECPPGLIYDKNNSICTCSVNSKENYDGITGCNTMTFQADLMHGYWAGYIMAYSDESFGTQELFRTCSCPRGFCANPRAGNLELKLPETTKGKDISEAVCSQNRTGILCGRCIDNNSVFYHMEFYNCYHNQHCKLGWLFYILSELVPVTILFIAIIWLDISFTKGSLYGFIFYVQVFEALHISANHMIWFHTSIYRLLQGFGLIIRMFNLKFFSIPELSFCLWEGANTLDIAAFNYITIIYSFILLLITIGLISQCSVKINKVLRTDKNWLLKSIIHGLSSFFILCYSQCTKINLFLLTQIYLSGETRPRVFYNGELFYFSGKHLKYVFPAVLFLVVITILPPLILISYPLCYKVLALCKLEESKFTKVLCKVIPLEKYKPFLDSFQGTFKDKHRYFAGLYFFYRFLILITFAAIWDLTTFYILIEIQLLLMMSLHAWIQPHKKKRHNQIDIAIFALLAVINGITLFNYLKIGNERWGNELVNITSSIQVLIAYIPLVCMCVYLVLKILVKLKPCFREKYSSDNDDEIITSITMMDYRDHMTKLIPQY